MFTTKISTILLCDECQKPVLADSDDSEGYPHFDSEAEALSALSWDPDDEEQVGSSPRGWLDGLQLTADTLPGRPAGQVLCFSCLLPLICAARGHRWTEWFRCRCRTTTGGEPCTPRIRSHANGCPEIRRCDRSHCYESEERTPVGAERAAEVAV